VFCNRLRIRHEFLWRVLAGRERLGEALRWRAWYRRNRHVAVHPYDAPGDRLPVVASWLAELRAVLRHPRAFLRQHVLSDGRPPARSERRTSGIAAGPRAVAGP
jgi:hypothetical protein